MKMEVIVKRVKTIGAYGKPGSIILLTLACGHQVWRKVNKEPKTRAVCGFCKLSKNKRSDDVSN